MTRKQPPQVGTTDWVQSLSYAERNALLRWVSNAVAHRLLCPTEGQPSGSTGKAESLISRGKVLQHLPISKKALLK